MVNLSMKEILLLLIIVAGSTMLVMQQKSIYRLQRQMRYMFYQPNFIVLGAEGIGELEEQAEQTARKLINERDEQWKRINQEVDQKW